MQHADSLLDVGELQAPADVALEVVDVPGGRWLTLLATESLQDVATKWFAEPVAFSPLTLRPTDEEPELLGLAFTQFALPVLAGPALDFDFHPAPNLHSPPALGLLLVRAGDRTTLVAPLTNVHEQVVAAGGGALRWGWHGDLDVIPAGFSTTVGIYDGRSATEVLARWAADVGGGTPPARRSLGRNPVTSHLSYWTDNGAAYWYRTEPARTIGASVAEAVTRLRAEGVPVHAVELDSWFYRHEIPRPIAEIGYPEEVPPTGMLEWLPRADAFDPPADPADPRDEIERWADDLGRPPLVLHARHISTESPYLAEGEWWTDLLGALPADNGFFRRWFDDAARWGACCIEQDWMLLYWFGVRAMRSTPGRARTWQDALDRHASDTGLGLLWCMATPADLIHASTLPHVVAVRTSDDYRFTEDPALLWLWFLTVNRLAGALELPAFKDVFFSQVPPEGADAIDGDPHAEVEALLAALSAGPVGIGDRSGRTDREVVLRTCDADGRLRHVDAPVALLDRSLFGAPRRGADLAWASTTATTPNGTWTYVVALNASMPGADVAGALPLTEIGVDGTRSVLDWRAGSLASTDTIAAAIPPRGWALFVVAPPDRSAGEGDLAKYVTMPAVRP